MKILKRKKTREIKIFINLGLAQEEGGAPVIMYTSGKAGLPETETTWAKDLQNHGYITQAVG